VFAGNNVLDTAGRLRTKRSTGLFGHGEIGEGGCINQGYYCEVAEGGVGQSCGVIYSLSQQQKI